MTLTSAHRLGAGAPPMALRLAHQELLRRYVQDRRHIEADRIKSHRRIVKELGGLMTRNTVRSNMNKMFPEIATEIRRQHT